MISHMCVSTSRMSLQTRRKSMGTSAEMWLLEVSTNIFQSHQLSIIFQYHLFSSSDPLSAPVVAGDLWIKREKGMFLNISWSGSPPYYYCYDYKYGPHNITINETCADDEWQLADNPWLTIHRFSLTENSFTILFQLRNQITNHTKIITINTYEVQKQSQLSVIVVPVAFILCAVVAIIFGVAHYVQTRNR